MGGGGHGPGEKAPSPSGLQYTRPGPKIRGGPEPESAVCPSANMGVYIASLGHRPLLPGTAALCPKRVYPGFPCTSLWQPGPSRPHLLVHLLRCVSVACACNMLGLKTPTWPPSLLTGQDFRRVLFPNPTHTYTFWQRGK